MEKFEELRTLRVLHLPPEVSDERRDELFKQQYGAVKTKTIRKSKKYSMTFVEFPTYQNAVDACHQLHQLLVQDRMLSVEFAKKNILEDDKENTSTCKIESSTSETDEDALKRKYYQEFVKKWNSWAPYDLITQPVPPHIKYKYPKPTTETLLRVAMQMIKVPALYTQVLHLMNKMNIPPPFKELEEEFPSIKEVYDIENYPDLFGFKSGPSENPANVYVESQSTMEDIEEESEEESEIESDKELGDTLLNVIPIKRKLPYPKKRIKIPKFVNPLKQPLAVPSQKLRRKEVFEVRTSNPLERKIIVKPVELTSKVLKIVSEGEEIVQPDFSSMPSEVEGFGLILPSNRNEQEAEKAESKPTFITTEQLHDNRISINDRAVLTVFKNYQSGIPSCRLYIKNLAKQVEESDLHFIYRRYILQKSQDAESEYNIRLMQEGRMKGQAFITLPNIAQAQLALEETNGYILKDKPMVVQFSKISKN